jgi:hypothetical protein
LVLLQQFGILVLQKKRKKLTGEDIAKIRVHTTDSIDEENQTMMNDFIVEKWNAKCHNDSKEITEHDLNELNTLVWTKYYQQTKLDSSQYLETKIKEKEHELKIFFQQHKESSYDISAYEKWFHHTLQKEEDCTESSLHQNQEPIGNTQNCTEQMLIYHMRILYAVGKKFSVRVLSL